MNNLPRVSVVTLNWNGQRFLEKLLPLLEKQTYPKDLFEVIVVDNDSTKDDSVEFVKKNFPDMKLLENTNNDGFARGCNLGMRISDGEYIVLLNNDTKPDPTWLEELVKCAVENKAGAVVSKLMYANLEGIINNAGSLLEPAKTWPILEIGANQKDAPEFNKVREITAFCGASVILDRKMLETIGLFDENFFMYFEDGDLSWRGQKAGYKYYYCPTSVVYHEHAGSSVEHSDFFTFYVTRNRLIILLKHAKVSIFLRGYGGYVKEFFIKPGVLFLKGQHRRHQLKTAKLGLKVFFSFLRHSFSAVLRRLKLIKEDSLTA